MTTSRIGRGALVTLGAAASMAWAAGAANACDTTPKTPTPPTQDHTHGHKTQKTQQTHTTETSYHVADCAPGDAVEFAAVGADGKAAGPFVSADKFYRFQNEPVYGVAVQLTKAAIADNCTVPVSLASYGDGGPTWEDSKGQQTFVDFATTTLGTKAPDSASDVLKVKLPGAPGAPCFGQIDLYFGSTKFDGKPGDGALPNHDKGVSTPTALIAAWNGPDAGGCAVVPPTKPVTPPVTTPPSTPPSTTTPPTTPTTHPSTPVTSTSTTPPAAPTTPKSTSSTPGTPVTTPTPGTPTLAHTGANVGEVSLVALAFFGAGGSALFASRKAKAAGDRRH